LLYGRLCDPEGRNKPKTTVMSKTLAKIAATMSPILGNMMFDPRQLIHGIDFWQQYNTALHC